jgi:tetratricopeptide (TPR) repeat protein
LDGALADFSEAIQRDPKDTRLFLARGAVYARLQKYPESLADRDQAVQLDPKNAEAYVARGGTYHLLGQHDKGLADRSTAIGLDPSYAVAWEARGNAYYMLGRFDEALGDLEQAQRLDPANQDTKRLAAAAKAKVDEIIAQAQAKEAAPETESLHLPNTVAAVQPAAARTPAPVQAPPAETADASTYHTRGRKLLQEEHYDEAIRQLTEALKLDPVLAQAYNARGFAHFRLKHYAKAIADFDEAIRFFPGYANAYVNRAVARRASGDTAGAIEDQARARELTEKGQ